METNSWLALTIFLIVYGMIVSEKIHRTKIALVGAAVVLLFNIMPQEQAIAKIDFNTLGLLTGMMIIIAITKRTGLFQFLAVKTSKAVGGHPTKIMVTFFVLTAVASALLDNVTTVLIFTSIIFAITDLLAVNPIPFLIVEIMASNIGGAVTLIGDPPNIMIGSATGLGFNDFIINLWLPILIIGLLTCTILFLLYRKQLVVTSEAQAKIMELDEHTFLTDQSLLRKCLFVLALTIIGFVLHQKFHFESATIALAGASLLMLMSKIDPEEVFAELEWNTIFFFIGLFILVGGLEATGLIKLVAEWALHATHGDIVTMNFLILWLSAFASAFVDNIPFVAAMIPLINSMAELGHMDVSALWWTLSLGACLGGNGTIIGASANVVVMSIAAAHGRPISFWYYFKIAFPLMIMSILISNLYLYLAYLH